MKTARIMPARIASFMAARPAFFPTTKPLPALDKLLPPNEISAA